MSEFEPFKTSPHERGSRRLYRFDNGYGASVIPDWPLHEGEVEVAVVKWYGDGAWEFDVITKTPAIFGVLRTDEPELQAVLADIARLTDDNIAAYRRRLKENGAI